MTSRLDPRFLTIPLAHRGLHDATRGVIENSPSAINAAVEAGYGIEIDIQPSAEPRAMVFHDYDLERLTGQGGAISAQSAAQLSRTQLSGSSDHIPDLPAVLEMVAGRVPLLIEIKDQDGRLGPNVGPFEAVIAKALENYQGPVAVMSFNPHAVKAFAQHAPDIAIGLVTSPFDEEKWPNVPETRRSALRDIPDAAPLNIDFISHKAIDLNAAPVARIKARGLPVLCWTIKSPEEETEARKVADNITFEGFTPAGHARAAL